MSASSAKSVTFYHNPRCGKSRDALALLQERGVSVDVVRYLETPLSCAELSALVRKLGMPAADLMRKGEDEYKARFAGRTPTEAEALDAMAAHPILMERPVAVAGERAVVGRPPARVLELL